MKFLHSSTLHSEKLFVVYLPLQHSVVTKSKNQSLLILKLPQAGRNHHIL